MHKIKEKNENYSLIDSEREILFKKYKSRIQIDEKLTRSLVSFQENKKESFYRWFKFKEGFSKKLVNYFIDKYEIPLGHILDPFAGSGATLFAAGAEVGNLQALNYCQLGNLLFKLDWQLKI